MQGRRLNFNYIFYSFARELMLITSYLNIV